MALTKEQIDEARTLRADAGLSYRILAERYGTTKYKIQALIDPEWSEKRNHRRKEWRRSHPNWKSTSNKTYHLMHIQQEPRVVPPREALFVRERMLQTHDTPNMLVLGDPPPWRSALGRECGE